MGCNDGLDANNGLNSTTDLSLRPSNILYYGNNCEGLYDPETGIYWLEHAVTTGTVPTDHEAIAWTGTGDNIYALDNTTKYFKQNIGCYSNTTGVGNWHISNNWIESAFDDGIAQNAAASQTIDTLYIRDNMLIKNGVLKGASNFACAITSATQYYEFCNNTLIENANGLICSAVAGKNHNNIYKDQQYVGNSMHVDYKGVVINALTAHDIDNNIYHGLGGWYRPGSPDVYYNNAQFANWQSATSKDTASLFTNPNLDANYYPTDSVCKAAAYNYWTTGPALFIVPSFST